MMEYGSYVSDQLMLCGTKGFVVDVLGHGGMGIIGIYAALQTGHPGSIYARPLPADISRIDATIVSPSCRCRIPPRYHHHR